LDSVREKKGGHDFIINFVSELQNLNAYKIQSVFCIANVKTSEKLCKAKKPKMADYFIISKISIFFLNSQHILSNSRLIRIL
jgi:hypothetical protein